jgi:hypothetical protein
VEVRAAEKMMATAAAHKSLQVFIVSYPINKMSCLQWEHEVLLDDIPGNSCGADYFEKSKNSIFKIEFACRLVFFL